MTIVRIRRRPAGADPTAGQLAEGEFGYAYASEKLFVGGVDGSTVTEVGGGSFMSLLTTTPGVATADKAAILDSNTEIDSWNVASLLTAQIFKTSLPVAAGFIKNDGSGNFLFGQTGAAATDLNTLTDVTLTSPASGEFLRNDGAGQFVNVLLGEADITDLQAYLLDITGESLGNLSDVTLTSPATNSNLRFNGSQWVDQTDLVGTAIQIDSGDVIITTTTKAYYLGDPATDGTWRFIRNGSDLEIQVRESGTYKAKTTITP